MYSQERLGILRDVHFDACMPQGFVDQGLGIRGAWAGGID